MGEIQIIATGGTLDKRYNELDGNLVFKDTHLNEMLAVARCTTSIELNNVMLKDSLDMDEKDREKILNACLISKKDKIIITHGTDTMVETAKLLGENIKNKTIVLTGAMIPYSFGGSDSLFNMGCAIASAQTLPNGIYIVMNGKIFSWDNVMKDKKAGEFKALR
ncbi:asparaginase domain-containing protein [candidate division KSB1 bacterium]